MTTNNAGAGGSYILQPDGTEKLVSRTEPPPSRVIGEAAPVADAPAEAAAPAEAPAAQPAAKKKGA